MKAVKAASLEDLQALPWLPDAVARAVHDKVHSPASRSTVMSALDRALLRP